MLITPLDDCLTKDTLWEFFREQDKLKLIIESALTNHLNMVLRTSFYVGSNLNLLDLFREESAS